MVISSPLEEAIGVAAELDTQYDFFSNPDGWKYFSADIWIREIIAGQNRQ